MNAVVKVGEEITIEVNFDPGLFVGLKVFDDSGVTPVQVGSTIPMLNVEDTLYRAKFTPAAAKPYLFRKLVFTDVGLTTPDLSFARSSEAVRAEEESSANGGGSEVTLRIEQLDVTLKVECD